MVICRWIQKQDTKELWLDGIDDYVEYANQISKEFEDVLSTAEHTTGPTSTPPASSGFFNFTVPAKSSQPLGTSSSGFAAFGEAKKSDVHENNEAEGVKEDQQAEEEIELEVDTSNADVLFTKRLHLLTQDPETKKWKDKGTGIFSLRRSKPADDSAKPVSYIVFAAASGRVLINAPVVKGLKPMVNPKSPANVIMFLISKQEDGTEKKEMHLFKCGSEETANEVVSHVAEQA